MLYQLSYEATHWERGHFVEFISSREEWNDVKYIWNNSLLRWSFFTFIYNRSTNMNYFIYTSHHFTPHGKIWAQRSDLAPNCVWLHSSVGRASHRYRGGHGFESRWSPDFFQASSFQLLKLENLLRWSLFTFTFFVVSIDSNPHMCKFCQFFSPQSRILRACFSRLPISRFSSLFKTLCSLITEANWEGKLLYSSTIDLNEEAVLGTYCLPVHLLSDVL